MANIVVRRLGSTGRGEQCVEQVVEPSLKHFDFGLGQRNKTRLAAYSITSSTCCRTIGGTERPSATAVRMLRMYSNRTGRSTGMSAGLVPFRILCTWFAARR